MNTLWFPFNRSTLETLNLRRSQVNMGQHAFDPTQDPVWSKKSAEPQVTVVVGPRVAIFKGVGQGELLYRNQRGVHE